jgi:hypothetical protein
LVNIGADCTYAASLVVIACLISHQPLALLPEMVHRANDQHESTPVPRSSCISIFERLKR